MQESGLSFLLILLAVAVVVSSLFRRIQLPSTLAYLCVGLLVQPAVGQLESIQFIAEFGIVFLLFSLGLEFSLPKLIALRHTVFVIGGLQVLISSLVIFLICRLLGANAAQSALIGGALALSSTAVVSKEISSRQELHQSHGQIAIGILLFQDLAAMLLLILVPVLSSNSDSPLLPALATTLGKGVLLVVLLLALGRWVLPRAFDEVARARSDELFVLAVLLTAMFAAALTHSLGLSMALGAFIAGMLLSETHHRHRIESDIRPFRDLLLGLFFASIGMMVELSAMLHYWYWIVLGCFGLLFGKALLVALLVRWRGNRWDTAAQTGVYLAQGGEFAFALFALASAQAMWPKEWHAVLVGIVFFSIALTPWLIDNATPRLLARLSQRSDQGDQQAPAGRLAQASAGMQQHVIICGFGRVGQTIARFLRHEAIPYLAVDIDTLRVAEASAAGEPVFYGDATKAAILDAMGVGQAALLVVSHAETDRASIIIRRVRDAGLQTPILVRTRDDSHLKALQSLGATEVVPETLEASLMLVSHVLALMHLPASRVFNLISDARRDRYQILHGYYHGLQSRIIDDQGKPLEILHPVLLPPEAWACGKTLAQTELLASVYALRLADGSLQPNVQPTQTLQAGDTLVLQGTHDLIESAERKLLAG